MTGKRKRLSKIPPKFVRISYQNSRRSTAFINRFVKKSVTNIDAASSSPIDNEHGEDIRRKGLGLAAVSQHDDDVDLQQQVIPMHQKKKVKLQSKWDAIRHQLLSSHLENLSPATNQCSLCGENDENVLKCDMCGPMAYFCEPCGVHFHQFTLFHHLEKWNGSVFLPFHHDTKLRRLDHKCSNCFTRNILVVDVKGLQKTITVTFCNLEEPGTTLLRYHLWPSTPSNPKVAFDINLMELLAVLQLHCQVSTKSFSEAIQKQNFFKIPSVIQQKEIYRSLVGECLLEYMFHRSNLNTRHSISTSTIGRECPVCQDKPSIVSMDANFGLVHKLSSGISHGLKTRHQDLYFKYDGAYREFVDDYNIDKNSLECSNFQAGSLLRSKCKNVKLDITGVFGCICKHDIPLHFLNMTKGESLAYSAFLITKLVEDRYDGDKVTITYDIACTLAKYIKKRNPELLEKCHLAVPVFHSFAHNMLCQLTYGQTFVETTGLTDGENIERFWSYLRPFKKITKEMTLNNRHDLLTESLIAYTENIILKIGNRLTSKLGKAEVLYEQQKDTLTKILACKEQDNSNLEGWYDALKAQCVKNSSKTDPDKIIQNLHGMAVERQHLCLMMKKYADGQHIWKRLCRNLTKNTNVMKKLILRLQQITNKVYNFKDVSDLNSGLYHTKDIDGDEKKAVEVYYHIKRLQYEISQSKQELNNLSDFMLTQSKNIYDEIILCQSNESRRSKGTLHYLYYHHYKLEKLWKDWNFESKKQLTLYVHSMISDSFKQLERPYDSDSDEKNDSSYDDDDHDSDNDSNDDHDSDDDHDSNNDHDSDDDSEDDHDSDNDSDDDHDDSDEMLMK